MKIKGILLPDEWMSAAGAGSDLLGAAKKTSYGVVKLFVSIGGPVLTGAFIFYVVDRYLFGIAGKMDEDVFRTVVTVVAILAGFMITTILFTGRPNGLSALTSHELREVRDKVSYLVLSQCLTLASHIACILFCLICIAAFSDLTWFPTWASTISAGLLLNSILRASILPLQIWEVHAFAIDVEISERVKAEKALIASP